MMNLTGLTWTSKDEELFKLLSAAKDPVPGTPSPLGVVALIGPTQCGKSRLVTHWAQEIEKCKVVYWNPQTDSPEDIGGFPHREKGVIRWTQPSIIPPEVMEMKGGWVLFVDELDKAQDDVLSCALTLLSERRIRDRSITPTAIVCAMNPPKRTLRPELLARLIFVPYPPQDYNFFERKDLESVAGLLGDIVTAEDPVLPQLPTTAGGAHRLKAWMESTTEFWSSEYCRRSVTEGTFSQQHAATVLGRLDEQGSLPAIQWARESDASELASGLIDVLHSTHQNLAKDRVVREDGSIVASSPDVVLEILAERAAADVTGEIASVLDAYYNTPKALGATERGAVSHQVAEGKAAMKRKWTEIREEPTNAEAEAEVSSHS